LNIISIIFLDALPFDTEFIPKEAEDTILLDAKRILKCAARKYLTFETKVKISKNIVKRDIKPERAVQIRVRPVDMKPPRQPKEALSWY
jgi:hypothetical protein